MDLNAIEAWWDRLRLRLEKIALAAVEPGLSSSSACGAQWLGSTLVSATLAGSFVAGRSVKPVQSCSSAAPSASTDALALAELRFANVFRMRLVFEHVVLFMRRSLKTSRRRQASS